MVEGEKVDKEQGNVRVEQSVEKVTVVEESVVKDALTTCSRALTRFGLDDSGTGDNPRQRHHKRWV